MRCTKCSFISFDDLSTCAKCASDLSALAKELNGTCIETKPEFFLGSAVQSSAMEENAFPDSQALPPMSLDDLPFDDTSLGGLSAASLHSDTSEMEFDDSARLASEDDVAIELGDILPIDFGQLDSDSVLGGASLGGKDPLSFDDMGFDLDQTDTLPVMDHGDGNMMAGFSDIDLPEALHDIDSSSFDATLLAGSHDFSDSGEVELDHELLADFAGDAFDETVSLDVAPGFDATQAPAAFPETGLAHDFDLDESLSAELTDASSRDDSGEFSLDFSVSPSELGEGTPTEALSVEEIPPIKEGEEPELSGLDLSDIDVADLVDPAYAEAGNGGSIAGPADDLGAAVDMNMDDSFELEFAPEELSFDDEETPTGKPAV